MVTGVAAATAAAVGAVVAGGSDGGSIYGDSDGRSREGAVGVWTSCGEEFLSREI